jgi:hypothetical protein
MHCYYFYLSRRIADNETYTTEKNSPRDPRIDAKCTREQFTHQGDIRSQGKMGAEMFAGGKVGGLSIHWDNVAYVSIRCDSSYYTT